MSIIWIKRRELAPKASTPVPVCGTLLAIVLVTIAGAGLHGQTSAPESYTLKRAVEEAWTKYPTIEAANAAVGAAASQVRVARDAYLPSASMHAQLTQATRNNILGAMLPNQSILPISGLAPNGASARGTFGSAMGILLSWTAYDFGTRRARIETAEANRAEAQAKVDLVRYQIADAVADAWFRAAASAYVEKAASASVERWRTALDSVDVLVTNGLRPGADSSRLRAELARAEAEQLASTQRTQQYLAEVGRYLMEPEKRLALEARWVSELYAADASASTAAVSTASTHPLVALRNASVSALSADAALSQREWLPKVNLYSAVSGRGSGARNDGTFHGGAVGLYPDTGNWAVGIGVTVDLFDWKRYRSVKELRDHRVEEARARESEASIELRTLIEQARIAFETSIAISKKTPEAVRAARELLTQSEVRYRTGLGTITELAEAQRTFQQAEVDDALARVSVWRAAYGMAAARGDLKEFLDHTH